MTWTICAPPPIWSRSSGWRRATAQWGCEPEGKLRRNDESETRGSRIGGGLTLTDARAEGAVLALELAHDASADQFTAASRDAFVADFDRTFGAQLCAQPALASFVRSRGGVRAMIETADGAPLASRTIASCA